MCLKQEEIPVGYNFFSVYRIWVTKIWINTRWQQCLLTPHGHLEFCSPELVTVLNLLLSGDAPGLSTSKHWARWTLYIELLLFYQRTNNFYPKRIITSHKFYTEFLRTLKLLAVLYRNSHNLEIPFHVQDGPGLMCQAIKNGCMVCTFKLFLRNDTFYQMGKKLMILKKEWMKDL